MPNPWDSAPVDSTPSWQLGGPFAPMATRPGAHDPTQTQWQNQLAGLQNSPGSTLPTATADADRQRMQALLQQLQGQAQTGAGAWQRTLAAGTQGANDAAMAAGQAMPGVSGMSALQGIQNAQAGNQQRAAGEGNILRAQTQQAAQQGISGILAAQGGTDAQQAAAQAAALQGVREAQDTINQQRGGDTMGALGAAGTAATITASVLGSLSRGGPVPGHARVFGDSEANDTVPAKLSPGEIVIPRSLTQRPDAAEAAAHFVAAVKARGPRHGQKAFDVGGALPAPLPNQGRPGTQEMAPQTAPPLSVASNPWYGPYGSDTSNTNPGTLLGAGTQAASQANGALLDPAAFNATRSAALANAQALAQQAEGGGPSVAPQLARNSQDAALTAAMQGQASQRGQGRGAAQLAGLSEATQSAEAGASKAAQAKSAETQQGAAETAQALQRQRAADLAFAQAQQQAAWRNTMLNTGIGIQQQQQLMGILGGAGQGAAALAGAFSGLGSGSGSGSSLASSMTPGYQESTPGGTDWANPYSGGEPGSSTLGGLARGGEVPGPAEAKRAAAFVRALRERRTA